MSRVLNRFALGLPRRRIQATRLRSGRVAWCTRFLPLAVAVPELSRDRVQSRVRRVWIWPSLLEDKVDQDANAALLIADLSPQPQPRSEVAQRYRAEAGTLDV